MTFKFKLLLKHVYIVVLYIKQLIHIFKLGFNQNNICLVDGAIMKYDFFLNSNN